MSSTHQFVPAKVSLTDDAPGWEHSQSGGPICWKCRGQPKRKTCAVCNGNGRLPGRPPSSAVGKITRARKRPKSFQFKGPRPYEHERLFAFQVENADVEIIPSPDLPTWLPTAPGEELCNLVGSWRILQRAKSHRWTTDDLCTAFTAIQNAPLGVQKYLDLGTGNSSVLLMTYWGLSTYQSKKDPVEATGIEARSEAVGLARRSLRMNIGPNHAKIVHGDFRDLKVDGPYDLITGTPPYFRISFDSHKTQATIQQGGMPSAVQSAPARCEFRGGIEAYCEAAARVASDASVFVVCENFLNHQRTLDVCRETNWNVKEELHVRGRSGKPVLFVVYTLVRQELREKTQLISLTVRGEQGEWTDEYKKVLDVMNIPHA